ncbi:ATP-binding protein [Marinomonas sp. C2222]|uniref:histidine kinase n=1 Tax=Marinomonas sargassi TaxID=2984494 RepID=A0ABT2YR52_9GAMM|nr:ATP-binding protein [Marinomonas sargassi]MCV2402367.1 ATP-binding protein [Marinomonas sargassi]
MFSKLNQNRLLSLLYGLGLLTLIFLGVHSIAYQFLIIDKHSEGQNRLLDYVVELREELKTYQILPYALTDNPSLLSYIKYPDNPVLADRLKRHLEDLTQVSKTQGWFIFSKQGGLLLSNEQSSNFVFSDYFDEALFSKRLKEHQGEHLLLAGRSLTNQETIHLALAPVYNTSGLVGAVGVRINIDQLIDRWNLFHELAAITDNQSRAVFSHKSNYDLNSDWLSKKKNIRFLDGTQAEVYQTQKEYFLLQSVLLDDLQWEIHLFADMRSTQTEARQIASFALALCALASLFWLYRRERALKIASKKENKILIEDSAQRQRALIENTHVGLMQLTRYGEISFVNPMGLRYLGQNKQLHNHRLTDFLPNLEENTFVRSFILELKKQQRPPAHLATDFIEQEVTLQKGDHTYFPALLSISALEWSDSQGYLVTFINISKRKKAELSLVEANSRLEERVLERTRALEDTQQELLRAEKLAAIGKMSTAITHEINQPLTGIKNLAYTTELLLKRKNIEQALSTLPDLISLVGRVQTLTNGLKVFAYQRPEHLSAISIKKSIMVAIENLGDEAQNANWNIQINETDKVIAEATRLERIFSNLISNSLQACQEADIPPSISLFSKSNEKQITIYYQDNGPGIQAEKLSHIFEPFFTTKPIGKGLGLGLAISANLAKDMNGSLTAYNNSSSELVFQLTLFKA